MDKINSLFMAPNLDSPMNAEAANDYKNGTWEAKAKQTTQQYAKWLKVDRILYVILLKNIKEYVMLNQLFKFIINDN